MALGRVVGEVWASRKVPGLVGRRLVTVAIAGEDRVIVAIDAMEARRGQEVLVAFGSGARNVLSPGPGNLELVCDAAVSLLVDGGGHVSR